MLTRPPICSNGTNQKNPQNHWRRRLSSYPHSRVLNTDSQFKRKLATKLKKKKRASASRWQRRRRRASSYRNFGKSLRLNRVSASFISLWDSLFPGDVKGHYLTLHTTTRRRRILRLCQDSNPGRHGPRDPVLGDDRKPTIIHDRSHPAAPITKGL